jgi:capsid protein
VNSGLARRCIDGIAAMIGSLTPVPLTDDKDWNQLALKSFNNNAGAEFIFDVAGKFNFWSAQPMLTALRLLDGDILTVLTESESGIARSMFYEAHQIGNADTDLDQTQWIDGVRVTPQSRAVAFRILTDDGKKSVDIPAQDAIFHCNYRRPGRARGEPALCHAINHLLDRSEIFGS